MPAARDPIGIRPLFYGYTDEGEIIFASEAKNLVPICDKIMPFPPGHFYDGETFVCYMDIANVGIVCHDDLETICKNIREKLTPLLERLPEDVTPEDLQGHCSCGSCGDGCDDGCCDDHEGHCHCH